MNVTRQCFCLLTWFEICGYNHTSEILGCWICTEGGAARHVSLTGAPPFRPHLHRCQPIRPISKRFQHQEGNLHIRIRPYVFWGPFSVELTWSNTWHPRPSPFQNGLNLWNLDSAAWNRKKWAWPTSTLGLGNTIQDEALIYSSKFRKFIVERTKPKKLKKFSRILYIMTWEEFNG